MKANSTCKGRLVVRGVLQILGMNVIRDHEKDYTEDVVQRYGMEGCKHAYTPAVGPERPLNQPEEKVLNEGEKRRYQAINGVVHLFRTSHELGHPLRGQSSREGHVQVRENSHGGGQASASLLARVHRFLHHLQAGWL